jgi:hypothetical protein
MQKEVTMAFYRFVRLLFCVAIVSTAANAQEQSRLEGHRYIPGRKLRTALQQLSVEAGRPVRIAVLQQQPVAAAVFSRSFIYALMPPHVDDVEVIHEVLHSALNIKGLSRLDARVSTAGSATDQGRLCGNVNDILTHPIIRARAKSLGYVYDPSPRYLKAVDYWKSAQQADESQFSRLQIALISSGLAGAYLEAPKYSAILRKEAHLAMPMTAEIADAFLKAFPPINIDKKSSKERLEKIVQFFDAATWRNSGSAPSSYLKIVTGPNPPPMTDDAERQFQESQIYDIR